MCAKRDRERVPDRGGKGLNAGREPKYSGTFVCVREREGLLCEREGEREGEGEIVCSGFGNSTVWFYIPRDQQ